MGFKDIKNDILISHHLVRFPNWLDLTWLDLTLLDRSSGWGTWLVTIPNLLKHPGPSDHHNHWQWIQKKGTLPSRRPNSRTWVLVLFINVMLSFYPFVYLSFYPFILLSFLSFCHSDEISESHSLCPNSKVPLGSPPQGHVFSCNCGNSRYKLSQGRQCSALAAKGGWPAVLG